MTGGIAARARFDRIRYAQVWEDADVLLAALAPRPGATLVLIASAGDNALALLTPRTRRRSWPWTPRRRNSPASR